MTERATGEESTQQLPCLVPVDRRVEEIEFVGLASY